VTPITISTLTLILLRNPKATPPNPKMSFQISQPDLHGPSAECVRLYLCRDSVRVVLEMLSQWLWLFNCSRELEEEIREEVRKRKGSGEKGVLGKEGQQVLLEGGEDEHEEDEGKANIGEDIGGDLFYSRMMEPKNDEEEQSSGTEGEGAENSERSELPNIVVYDEWNPLLVALLLTSPFFRVSLRSSQMNSSTGPGIS